MSLMAEGAAYQLYQGDCVAWANGYNGPLFHALLCDAPYHLTTITDRFGNEDSAPAKGGVYARASKGFMGKQWDGGDLAFRPETWAAFMRVLHPGAFIMAFASSRGWHRMACAIEDAGFIIHPSIFLWAQGQGFPKATRIDTQVDKAAGAVREVSGLRITGDGHIQNRRNAKNKFGTFETKNDGYDMDTAPATPLAAAWEGHRYGGQALKPAVEVIIVAQKPYAGRPLDCIVNTGAGALNIEAGRIGVDNIPSNRWTDNAHPFGGGAGNEYETVTSAGRWPANLILSHLPGCNGECVDGCAVKAMGKQSGESGTDKETRLSRKRSGFMLSGSEENEQYADAPDQYADSGTATRFFYNADYTLNKLEQAEPVFYCAKAGRAERDAGLEGIERKRDAHNLSSNACARCGMRVKANGSGEKCECGDLRETVKLETTSCNPHPTVKPLNLTQHLASLLLPPAMYAPRRLFVPFSGAGSEMIGAILAGWEFVQGVEIESEYVDIAEARLKFWSGYKPKPQEKIKPPSEPKADSEQLSMFSATAPNPPG